MKETSNLNKGNNIKLDSSESEIFAKGKLKMVI